jgi:hypothetical protein
LLVVCAIHPFTERAPAEAAGRVVAELASTGTRAWR